MTSNRHRAIFLGLGPRRAIWSRIAHRKAGLQATRRVGFRGPEQKDRLAELFSAKSGKRLNAAKGLNDLEEEGETILRTHLKGNAAEFLGSDEDASERDEPSGRSTVEWCDLSAVSKKLEQVIPTGTNTGNPFCQKLSADEDTDFAELANRIGEAATLELDRIGDAGKHKLHARLFAGQGVVRQDALAGTANQTTSKPDHQYLRTRQSPEPPWDPMASKSQVFTPATRADTTLQNLLGCRALKVVTIPQFFWV